MASIVFNEPVRIFKINHKSAEGFKCTVCKNYKSRVGDVRVCPADIGIPSAAPFEWAYVNWLDSLLNNLRGRCGC